MALAWQNNPRGICEDAPCCGCCGPQGDGRFDTDEPYDPDDFLPDYDEFEEEYDEEEDGETVYEEPSPDPYWYMD